MLGIYYLDYCKNPWPKRARQMIICYTREDTFAKVLARDIPADWFFWLSECRTPGYLVTGSKEIVMNWIEIHMPDKFGEPLR